MNNVIYFPNVFPYGKDSAVASRVVDKLSDKFSPKLQLKNPKALCKAVKKASEHFV